MECMEAANLAAIALKLQATALEAEERIFEAERQLRLAVNPPTVVQTATTTDNLPFNVNTNGPGLYIGPGAAIDFTIDFNNTGIATTVDDLDPQQTEELINFLGEGIYQVGMSVTVTASGTVNDNSFRLFRVIANRPDPNAPLGFSEVQEASLTLHESNTGIGVSACVVGHFRLAPGDFITFKLQHGNTSSALTTSIGNRFWFSKLSSASFLGVT